MFGGLLRSFTTAYDMIPISLDIRYVPCLYLWYLRLLSFCSGRLIGMHSIASCCDYAPSFVCLVCILFDTFIPNHHAFARPRFDARTHATARRPEPAAALRASPHRNTRTRSEPARTRVVNNVVIYSENACDLLRLYGVRITTKSY
eukprot:6212509-Pleurochrysis_carterae.AAC.2